MRDTVKMTVKMTLGCRQHDPPSHTTTVPITSITDKYCTPTSIPFLIITHNYPTHQHTQLPYP